MAFRYHFPRHNPYNTPSNKVKIVKTPGGKLTVHHRVKKSSRPVCGDTGKPLNGVKAVRPYDRKHMKKRQLRVSRAYGGCKSHSAVKERIIRAFLLDEQKIVKEVMNETKQKKEVKTKNTDTTQKKPPTKTTKHKGVTKAPSKKSNTGAVKKTTKPPRQS